jgi:hypothetical protein
MSFSGANGRGFQVLIAGKERRRSLTSEELRGDTPVTVHLATAWTSILKFKTLDRGFEVYTGCFQVEIGF